MSEYRRFYQPGGSYFFTVVTYNRMPILTVSENLSRLQQSFEHVMNHHDFTIEAMVVLPDHLHCIWQLPPGDSDFSTRWRLIKRFFSIKKDKQVTERGEKNIWQRRFWEHFLRDEEDWRRHMDYIHYNPVKHGYVQNPADWPHSSFHKALHEGLYPVGWGTKESSFISDMDWE
jgi:putative transposase